MTSRQAYQATLIELSKVNAPSLLLEEYNYFYNKAVNLRVNKWYNIYDVNLQTTDDLRVLKATAELTPKKVSNGIYEVYFPLDYLHLLNCICEYRVANKRYKCNEIGDSILFAAKRLTADSWSVILNNYYNRPTPQNPYYYINNVNTSENLPTNPNVSGTLSRKTKGTDVKLPNKISIKDITNNSLVEKEAGLRYGNASSIRCEIRCGNDSNLELDKIIIDYLKTPLLVELTLEQINLTDDTSLILEFPDYGCHEIINELVMLVLENNADPRLQTNTTVTQSIANPVQQLAPQLYYPRRRNTSSE